MLDLEILEKSLLKGDRVALGQAITLIESAKQADREEAAKFLNGILKNTGNSLRIGITGVPGVGKSTFIEALGTLITGLGKKLAVLAVDPSSPSSKGSILGDKTRMSQLAVNTNAFIRPTPAAGQLGGVANRTIETILLCEAAGYDVIIIETVGVGQSEVAVKNMTDVFLLLMLAGAGDELQGIKRGIMEMADLLVINKADGDNLEAANLARNAYENAVHLLVGASDSVPPVLISSAITGSGVEKVWNTISEYHNTILKNGSLDKTRSNQKKYWLQHALSDELLLRIKEDKSISLLLPKVEKRVLNDEITPLQAADIILSAYFKEK